MPASVGRLSEREGSGRVDGRIRTAYQHDRGAAGGDAPCDALRPLDIAPADRGYFRHSIISLALSPTYFTQFGGGVRGAHATAAKLAGERGIATATCDTPTESDFPPTFSPEATTPHLRGAFSRAT